MLSFAFSAHRLSPVLDALLFIMFLALLGTAQALNPAVEQVLSFLSSSATPIKDAEWNEMTFFQRVRAYDWQMEYLILGTFFLYIAFHKWGSIRNQKKVDDWMNAVRPVLEAEFSDVGCNPTQEIIKDSTTRFAGYATGRVNIQNVNMRFHLVDRHNAVAVLCGLFVPALKSFEGIKDEVLLEIVPLDPMAIEPMIFAVCHKENMSELRDANYYLSLTRTTDSPKLPPYLCFMSEHKDVIDACLTPELQQALTEGGDLIEMIAVTDQSSTAPEKIEDVAPQTRVYASFRYPAKGEEAKLAKLVAATLHLVDHLISKKPLRPETAKKIKQTRDASVVRIKRKAEKERQEQLELKRAEERRNAEREMDKLSEKEQRKLAKKQQEKEQRKLQKKQKLRG